MLKMKQLLTMHDRSVHPLALEDCLGDGYLLLHNPIFAALRSRFIDIGGTFISDDSSLCADYRVAPLLCLRQIIEQRTVPYHRNASVFRRLVTSNPNMEISGPYLMQSYFGEQTLHEVEPTGTGGREVNVIARMARQPGLYLGVEYQWNGKPG